MLNKQVSVPWILQTYFSLKDDSDVFIPSLELLHNSDTCNYLEFALFCGKHEVMYPGYERVQLYRRPENFSFDLEDGQIIIRPKEHIDFPEVGSYKKECKKWFGKINAIGVTENYVIISHFKVFLGSLNILTGCLSPRIYALEGTIPRILNKSTFSYTLGSTW